MLIKIVIGKLKTSATNYKNLDPADLTIINKVIAVLGLVIKPTNLTINEGASKSISVSLASQPTSEVTVSLTPTDGEDQADLLDDEFLFTPQNWNVPQSFSIEGLADDGPDGDQPFQITVETDSDDDGYAQLGPKIVNLTIHNTD